MWHHILIHYLGGDEPLSPACAAHLTSSYTVEPRQHGEWPVRAESTTPSSSVTRSAVFCGTRWPAPVIAMTVFERRVLPPGLSRHGNNCRPAVVFDIVEHVSTL
jgi:hypothetical protein